MWKFIRSAIEKGAGYRSSPTRGLRLKALAMIFMFVASGSAPSAAGPPIEEPWLIVVGASAEEEADLHVAIGRFHDANLVLPPLKVVYGEAADGCRGNTGWFAPGKNGQRDVISVCDTMHFIVVHELAHAWERHAVSDDARRMLLDRFGLEEWNNHNDAWADRGIEKAAQTIAFGLTLEDGSYSRHILDLVCGFEDLAGVSPPLADRFDCAT